MSDEKISNPITNESIIEELTKDLKSSISVNDETPPKDEFVINPGTSADDFSSKKDAKPTGPEHREFDEDHKEKEDSDTDSIDEVALKDAEVDMTEDQVAERKIIAEGLKISGNDAFKRGEFELSIEKYTEGLRVCPLGDRGYRAILYCNRSAAKMKLEKYERAIKDCTKALELDERYLKAYIRRAQSYEATDKLDECLEDYKKVLELEPANKDAQRAAARLPPLIEERNEKMKTEMLGKLKDIGNMILKPFGLSTENFQLNQDPASKGYTINFKQ